MRRILLSFAVASAIVSAAAIAAPARALTVGTASTMRAALEETGMLNEVAYVCRHRYYTSRRVCWWRPDGRSWWPWRRWRRY